MALFERPTAPCCAHGCVCRGLTFSKRELHTRGWMNVWTFSQNCVSLREKKQVIWLIEIFVLHSSWKERRNAPATFKTNVMLLFTGWILKHYNIAIFLLSAVILVDSEHLIHVLTISLFFFSLADTLLSSGHGEYLRNMFPDTALHESERARFQIWLLFCKDGRQTSETHTERPRQQM